MEANITIKGIIGVDTKLIDVVSQVSKQPNASSYNVSINTVGGNVDEGFNIYNYLTSLGLPINMVGHNVVASIGTVIFMAGTTRRIEKNTNFFIHLPSIPNIENATAQDLESFSKEMRKIESKVIDFYVTKTSINKEAIEPLLQDETYLSEEQLFDLGFTTEKSSIEIKAVAFLDTSINKNQNKMNKKKQAKTIIEMVKDFLNPNATMKMVLTADQKELDFADLADEDAISKGDKATLDGETPEGEVILADGRTLVFEAGVVSEIIEVVIDDTTEEMEVLKKELSELKAEKEAQATSLEKATAELKDAKKVLKKIHGIQSQMLIDGKKKKKSNESIKSDISADVDELFNL